MKGLYEKLSWWMGTGYYLFRVARRSKRVTPILLWALGIYVVAWLFYGDDATRTLFLVIGVGLQLLFAMFFMVIQFVAIFWFMARSRTTVIRPGDPKAISFSDYWGQPALVKMMKEWLFLIKDRGQFIAMGGKPISGILLSGPPGTGKSMMAKAMAGDSGVAFIGCEGSGFRAMFMGVDVMKVISFFKKARELAREYGAAIAFIDEIDAIGASRGGVQGGGMMMGGMMGMGGGSGALTRLLYEMDGLGETSEYDNCIDWARRLVGLDNIDKGIVMVMGSTNRPDVLDPALVRPGRFDRTIQVDPPDRTGRREVIEGYLAKIKYRDIDVDSLVADTAWATPAKIASILLKDSVRIALFSGRDYVTQRDIEAAMMEQAAGISTPILDLEPEQKKQIAIHEASHAVVQYKLRKDEKIVHLSITRRTGSLGLMLPVSLTDVYAMPLDTLTADIMVSMAGHIGTELILGRPWTGASADFQNVRSKLYMLSSLGYFGDFPIDNILSDGAKKKIDEFLKKCADRTREILQDNIHLLNGLVDALLKRSDLSGEDVKKIILDEETQYAANQTE